MKEILRYVQNHVHLFFFCLKLDKIEETDLEDSFVETEIESFQNENTFSSSEQEQTQLGESFSSPEVESDNLSESDIGPFKILYGEMNEDNFYQKMEANDWTFYPLFSDKEFLNEGWCNYTCIESCTAIEDARHGCESVGTDIQSIREIDDSGCMLTNITGSSILKSTDHTSQMKPGKLSDRFILSDREPCSDNPSSVFERTSDLEQSKVVSEDESEIGIVSESEGDWKSCVSSEEEDECFYDAVSLVNSHNQSLNSLPHQVTETPCETNLDGLVLGCRQPSKSDQASDLEEKASLHVAIQVSELNETYLCEGKQKIENDVSHLRILSNMMEKETHVDSTSSGEQADICQILFAIVEDQSDVHGRAVKETAISGHPQSDQLRSGKPDGEPGTHITTTISDSQSQMVEGNLSLNSPNSCTGNLFYDIYYCLKDKSMDGSGIWSKPSDTSQYVKAEINSSVTYSFEQKKHQIAALSNKCTDDNTSVDKIFNSKKQNFDAANCNVPKGPNIFHNGRTSLYNVYNTLTLTLINNGHLSIVCIA